MCGVTGVVLNNKSSPPPPKSSPLTELLHLSIQQIQHRGYDGCGIAYLNNQNKVTLIKNNTMIQPFFQQLSTQLANLPSSHQLNQSNQIGIAHTRYKTVGPCTQSASQPLLSPDETICLAHNGQIDVVDWYPDSGYILDYMIKNLVVDTLQPVDAIFHLVESLMQTLVGSYSCVTLVANVGLVAFRDPRGIRPLILGKNAQDDYIVASESVCIEAVPGFSIVRDIYPGECIIITPAKLISKLLIGAKKISKPFTPCIFEYIYLASPRSIIDGLPVYVARRELGILLAHHISRKYSDLDIDVVVPVPESSRIATLSLVDSLNELRSPSNKRVQYLELLKLNTDREKARSFILPTQELREQAVAAKFVIDPDDRVPLEGKNILIVDDSIVRGTTLRHVVAQVRSLTRCNQIFVASVAPPITNSNKYGIDIPDTELLVAQHGRSIKEIEGLIGADRVIYQDLQEMLAMFARISPIAKEFEHSMFY